MDPPIERVCTQIESISMAKDKQFCNQYDLANFMCFCFLMEQNHVYLQEM